MSESVVIADAGDKIAPCGCRYLADTAQFVFCSPEHGCARCRKDAILANTEDWQKPVCVECWEDVGKNPLWHEAQP